MPICYCIKNSSGPSNADRKIRGALFLKSVSSAEINTLTIDGVGGRQVNQEVPSKPKRQPSTQIKEKGNPCSLSVLPIFRCADAGGVENGQARMKGELMGDKS